MENSLQSKPTPAMLRKKALKYIGGYCTEFDEEYDDDYDDQLEE